MKGPRDGPLSREGQRERNTVNLSSENGLRDRMAHQDGKYRGGAGMPGRQ